jgi:hypothetical protein
MIIFKLMLFVALICMPALTWARGDADVANGVHNLSTSGVDPYWGGVGSSLYASNEDQICVFCHTPHGGSLTAALWNRNDPAPAGGWNHYNSASMSIDPLLSVGRVPNDESMICLSCHDGSISVNHIINLPNDRLGAPILIQGSDSLPIYGDMLSMGPGKRIGASFADNNGTGDLSDDHPISFSYEQVLGSYEYSLGSKVGDLKIASIARSLGVEFFGSISENNVECSSCHDPHVDYISDPAYDPFLITPNSNSDLCLACHTK